MFHCGITKQRSEAKDNSHANIGCHSYYLMSEVLRGCVLFSCSDMQKCQAFDLHNSPPLHEAAGDGVERGRSKH